jgi:hypothetical protein
MAGLAIVATQNYTDTSLPVIDFDDEILTAGSLLLHDLSHSVDPLAAGAPATGALIPNIAWKRTAALLGAGDQASLKSTFTSGLQAADGFVERSAKGGVHVCISQAGFTAGRGARIRSAATIEAYLFAHPDNDFYFSRWTRITRAALATTGVDSFEAGAYNFAVGITGSRQFAFFRSGFDIPADRVAAVPGKNTLGNVFRNIGTTDWTGTKPTIASQVNVAPAIWGNLGAPTAAAPNPAVAGLTSIHPSSIFYRAYLEDLTVSGRTYAQVSALDQRIWQEAMAVGGRYAGDTFTDPATLP